MPRSVQPSFYRHALKLPDSEAVRMLHSLAREIFRERGGEAIERHVAAYEAIAARWLVGFTDANNGERVGLREGMRAMGSAERGYARLTQLREEAWLQARAEVFQQTGERIPLPQTPEDADRAQSAEEAAAMKQLSSKLREAGKFAAGLDLGSGAFSGGSMPEKVPEPLGAGNVAGDGSGTFSRIQPRENEPDPAVGSGQRPSNKQIKAAVRRLIDAQVSRDVVEKIRNAAKAGAWSYTQFMERVEKLVGAA